MSMLKLFVALTSMYLVFISEFSLYLYHASSWSLSPVTYCIRVYRYEAHFSSLNLFLFKFLYSLRLFILFYIASTLTPMAPLHISLLIQKLDICQQHSSWWLLYIHYLFKTLFKVLVNNFSWQPFYFVAHFCLQCRQYYVG